MSVETERDLLLAHLRAVVDRWKGEYHCCGEAKRGRGHDAECPLAAAIVVLTTFGVRA